MAVHDHWCPLRPHAGPSLGQNRPASIAGPVTACDMRCCMQLVSCDPNVRVHICTYLFTSVHICSLAFLRIYFAVFHPDSGETMQLPFRHPGCHPQQGQWRKRRSLGDKPASQLKLWLLSALVGSTTCFALLSWNAWFFASEINGSYYVLCFN